MTLRRLFVSAVLLILPVCGALLRAGEPDSDPGPVPDLLAKIVDSRNFVDADRVKACDALKELGPRAVGAAPALVSALHDDDPVRTHAAEALVGIGPGAIPALRAAMKIEERESCSYTALTWAAIDVNEGIGSRVLYDRLINGQAIERYEAALALARSEPPADVIPILEKAYKTDPEILVRHAANVAIILARSHLAADAPTGPPPVYKDWPPMAQALPRRGVANGGAGLAVEPHRLPQELPPLKLFSPARLTEIARTAEFGAREVRIQSLRELASYRSAAYPVADRIRKLFDDPDAEIRQAASDALFAMGGAAMGQWLDALQSRDAITRRLAAEALAEPWLNKFADRAELLKRLTRLLDDPDPPIHQAVALALCSMWPDSEPILTSALKGGDKRLMQVVIELLLDRGANLAAIGTVDPPRHFTGPPPPIDETFADFEAQVYGHLLRRMKSSIGAERDRAFAVLRQFESVKPRRELSNVLVWELEDDRPSVFLDAAEKLASLGPEAAPALIAGTKAENTWVRKICVEALASRIGGAAHQEAVAAMTTALSDGADEVRRAALTWAESLGQPPPGAVEKLTAWISLNNAPFAMMYPNDRARGAALLGKWAVQSATCVPALLRALGDDYGPKVQLAAITALGRFGAEAVPAAPKLLPFLRHRDEDLARAAADTLTVLGMEIHGAVAGFLRREIRAGRPMPERLRALHHLAAIGPGAAPAVADLKALLADPESDLREEVIAVLAAIGPGAAPAVADLTAMLSDNHNELRIEVAAALGAIGPRASAALPALTRMADNRNADVRQAACDALLKISPGGRDLGPALIATVMNRDRVWSARLAFAIRRSASAPALFARLTDLSTADPDAAVRTTARNAAELLVVRE